MRKIRQTIVGIASAIYLILFITKVNIPGKVAITLLFVLLANLAIEEWIKYKETKRKIHLLMPIATIILIIYVVSNLIYRSLN